MRPRKPLPATRIVPENWDREVVPRIMNRAKNCCEKCGIEHWKRVYTFNLLFKRTDTVIVNYPVSFIDKKEAERECPVGQEVKISNAILHVIYKKIGDVPDDVKDSELIALCQSCEDKFKK